MAALLLILAITNHSLDWLFNIANILIATNLILYGVQWLVEKKKSSSSIIIIVMALLIILLSIFSW